MFNLNLKAVIYGVLTYVGLYFINILVLQLLGSLFVFRPTYGGSYPFGPWISGRAHSH
jgi:hypothetical protein